MQKPVIDETKLPEVKKIIYDADSILSVLYCARPAGGWGIV